jgi:hypothetical protein
VNRASLLCVTTLFACGHSNFDETAGANDAGTSDVACVPGTAGCVVLPEAAACDKRTCPTGCCDTSGQCEQGITGLACGSAGTDCQNCLAMSEQCSSLQECVPSSSDAGPQCDSQTCPFGCCDASAAQMQCPGSYTSCPPSLQQPAPTRQHSCSTADLQNAASACADGASASTASCDSFFGCSNTACAACLKQFDFDFVDQIGIRTCVAPLVDATCNHNNACIADCTAESCFRCADNASTSQCETRVQSGTCAAYTQADQCVVQALAGAAAFCNPVTYQEMFGAWLQGVGAKYCGL